MAGLWTGTTLNNNILASVFNQVHNKKVISMVTKANPLLYSFMGRPGDDGRSAYNKNLGGWMKSEKITGDKHEVRLRGALPSYAAIADGSDELTDATINYDNDHTGAAVFILAHYGLVHGVPDSEYDRIRGDEAKTLSWIDETHEYLMDGFIQTMSNDLHENSTSAVPARDQFGSILAAVDDGNTYGTIDRSDSGNVDFRAIVSSMGTMTLRKIQDLINQAKDNRGQIRVGCMGTTLFGKFQDLVQGYSQATYDRDTASWGSDHIYFAGVEWLQDRNTVSGTVFGFDPRTWKIIWKDAPFTETGLIKDPRLKAGRVINTVAWLQNFCMKPNSNWKATSVS
jgi:hypothetical protein